MEAIQVTPAWSEIGLKRHVQSWVHLLSLRKRQFTGLRSRTPVLIERENILVKTVETFSELEAALKLRHRVYREEYDIPEMPYELDLDAYDSRCDHLVIINKRSGEIIGTYRLLCSDRHDQFYSESEFDLTGLIHLRGTKVELGRACIASEHRTGATLALLWRGILSYCQQAGASYLFGCSSVKVTEPREVARLVLKLQASGHLVDQLSTSPRGKYRMEELPALIEQERDLGFGSELGGGRTAPISPLLLTYLKAGAKIQGMPALDRDFHCIDFLTLLDLRELSSAYERKFGTA